MILIVDDEPSALVLLERVLQQDNYVVRKATSARGALRVLQRGGEERCTLLITAIRMPDMDGQELLAAMRADRRLAKIPVVMCTSETDRATVVGLIGQGVRDYIVKPFKPSTVLERLRAMLADEEPIIEPRTQTTQRLWIDESGYERMVDDAIPILDSVANDMVSALSSRNGNAARAAAERVRQPATSFRAGRAIAAADGVLNAASDSDAFQQAGILVAEIGGLRAALQRAVAARRL